MENKTYKYDAFISYRHCELDKFVAENLHKILENYELPKKLKEKLNVKGKTFKRVFRDQEELPLSSNLEDPILDALKESKYLIVICSPRLKDSLWCKKEIQTFKELRGRENILCVLVEGEPNESFPEEVLFDEVEITLENGTTKKERKPVEPLAADVRGKSKKEVLKKIKEEKLRLAAAMYSIDYDDLKQRHKLRKQKKILTTSIIISIACILFTIYSLIMVIKINTQQNILAEHQALALSSKAEEYLKIDNRYDAIKASYQALTNFEEVGMPYTSEAEYALVESLGVYDAGSSYKVISEIQTKGVADHIKTSENNKYAAVYDESEEITVFNTKTLNIIGTYPVKDMSANSRAFSFIGNDVFSYINEKGNISLINTENGKLIKEIEKEEYSYYALQGDENGNYLIYTDMNKLGIYNVKENTKIGEISSDDNFAKEMYFSSNSDYVFVGTAKQNYDINAEEYLTIHVINTKEAKEINNVTLNAAYISGMITNGNNVYLLLNNRLGTDMNMLVVSYDFVNGKTNWTKSFENKWGKFITKSYPEGTNNIAVVNHDTVNVLNADDGSTVESFNASDEIINIYSFLNKETYLIFLKNGSVNFINMEYRNIVEYMGRFEFNLSEYSKISQSEDGFLLIPENENRVILYEEKVNEDIKEENIQLDYPKDDSIYTSEKETIIEEYNIKNKNLIKNIFYDTDKELVFVNYTNKDIAIYRVSDKKLLNVLSNVGTVNHYFGKDKDGRIYIGDLSNSYILDKNYNKVGRIKSLRKLEEDRVIVSNDDKFYSIKIYSLNEMLKEAEEYLNR